MMNIKNHINAKDDQVDAKSSQIKFVCKDIVLIFMNNGVLSNNREGRTEGSHEITKIDEFT